MDWKKVDAARELGLDPSVIGRYLKEEAIPSLTVLKLLAERTGIPLDLPGEPPRSGAIKDGPRWLEAWESDVIHLLRRLDLDARRGVLAGVRSIIEAVHRPIRYSVRSDPAPPSAAGVITSEEVALQNGGPDFRPTSAAADATPPASPSPGASAPGPRPSPERAKARRKP